jgi:hypothetical protein
MKVAFVYNIWIYLYRGYALERPVIPILVAGELVVRPKLCLRYILGISGAKKREAK